MKLPSSINDLLQKPMDRKEFLKHVGVAGLLVVGGGFIAKSLGILGDNRAPQVAGRGGYGYGYGASVYGGSKNAA